MNRTTIAVFAIAGVLATGCVSKGKYDEAVAQTQTTRAELARKDAILDQASSELAMRRAEIARLKAEITNLEKISQVQTAEGRARLGELQNRLRELQAAQAAAEARAALYRDLTTKLKKQIDDGDLTIVVRDGRMVLQLPDDVLFDTGRTELKPAGKTTLEAVAAVMRIMPHRHFQVAGHTDNVPIRNDRFPSNWELSSGRALRVVHFLMDKGVEPGMLSAAGYADVDPVAPNATAEGKKMNRRTEITLQPDISELVHVP